MAVSAGKGTLLSLWKKSASKDRERVINRES